METLGSGKTVAFWFNARARRVTPEVIEAFRAALPAARCFAPQSLEEAAVHARQLAAQPPELLLCGGGDGTIVTLLNLLRESGLGTFPRIGLLKLGTGNGWAGATSAWNARTTLARLPQLPRALPTLREHLIEVEGRLCHFCGAGWDAHVLNDYQRNLARRGGGEGFVSRLHQGPLGYLYAIATLTVPELSRRARPSVRIDNLGAPPLGLDDAQHPTPIPADVPLWNGPFSEASAAIEPTWGSGFRANPHARLVPGRLNLRIYDTTVLAGAASVVTLWRGAVGDPHMHDFFVTRARLQFDAPLPVQLGGDVLGARDTFELAVAAQTVELIDWSRLSPREG
jgi:diacylglycerol kinase family enzyme